LVISDLGKGKVLYSASSLESLFYSNGNPELKKLIASMVPMVAEEPAPYSVKAPSALITNMAVSEYSYILHLTNWTGDKFEMKHVMEDYIAPAENIEITIPIPQGRKVESVKSLTGSQFRKNSGNGSIKIVIPRVNAYEGIEIKFAR